jgi:signal transduction histidine kinase
MAALIADIVDALTRDTNLKRTLKRCSEAMVYRMEAVVARIWTLNTGQNTLELQSTAGMATRLDGSQTSIHMQSNARISNIALEKRCLVSNEPNRDGWLQTTEWTRDESIISYIGIPLIVNNGIVGVMELFSRSVATDVEIEAMQSVADVIAVGIQRRSAEDQLQKLNTELERRVNERTTQLEAAIKELDAFAYSVAHDLRAPLRSINGFSQALISECDPQLPDQARLYIERVSKGADRMGRLIDDLLELSFMGCRKLIIRPADIKSVLNKALSEIRLQNMGRHVDVIIADLPVCACDADLIGKVCVNLIDNSFKYTRSQAEPRIEIDYQFYRDEHVFSVSDNGTGFEMQYSREIFEPFQRLHRAEDYEGSGVGLAIVQRIVKLHGGRVWAKSQPNEGATFYFTLKGETPHE